jgi:hypothetical protein
MSAPTPAPDLPERLPSRSSESINGGVATPLRMHTPGPIPPVDDDDDEDEDRKRGGTGGNIDPDDEDDDVDDDEDDDDEADKQWAGAANVRSGGADTRFVLYWPL